MGERAVGVGDADDGPAIGERGQEFAGQEGVAGAALLRDQADVGGLQHGPVGRVIEEGQESDVAQVEPGDLAFEQGSAGSVAADDDLDFVVFQQRSGGGEDFEALFHAKVAGVNGQKLIGVPSVSRAEVHR